VRCDRTKLAGPYIIGCASIRDTTQVLSDSLVQSRLYIHLRFVNLYRSHPSTLKIIIFDHQRNVEIHMENFRRINLRGRARTFIRGGLVLQLSFVASAMHDRINEA
jgi:hypothetical protein